MTAYKPIGLMSTLQNGQIALPLLLQRLAEHDRNLNAILDRGIRFEDNVDCAAISFTSSATPNDENTVAHALGKPPTGFIVYDIDKGAVVYRGGTTWNKTNIYLKVNTASVAVKAWVF